MLLQELTWLKYQTGVDVADQKLNMTAPDEFGRRCSAEESVEGLLNRRKASQGSSSIQSAPAMTLEGSPSLSQARFEEVRASGLATDLPPWEVERLNRLVNHSGTWVQTVIPDHFQSPPQIVQYLKHIYNQRISLGGPRLGNFSRSQRRNIPAQTNVNTCFGGGDCLGVIMHNLDTINE
ncbi:hypothetical protein Ciccas_008174 [Cichlidogyrus casuarinus]|uniref:Uncharacterized protein n=1 Tax=Cichlidogyrus casuarinus TaxID=1844966 RepID=A0ABD2Q115_9PLAT